MAQTAKSTNNLIPHERVIIERPRLIRKLDGCEARTILLVAPAGYGKTTLTRQWTATLSRVVWVSLTSAHRDVAVLTRDLAHEIEELGDEGFASFIDQYLRARANPQSAGRELANVIAAGADRVKAQWLVLDDYHELTDSRGAQCFVEAMRSHMSTRFLITSRRRPTWASTRTALYGEIDELGQADLAMNSTESSVMVGRRGSELRDLISKAEGWPAVLALAARVEAPDIPAGSLLPQMLHSFLAEELFAAMAPATQETMTTCALLPPVLAIAETSSVALDMAFVLGGDGTLHPLMCEFLLTKLAATPGGRAKALEAVEACVDGDQWESAFELVLRFELEELVAPTLRAAYKPLVQSGRIWTLAQFALALKQRRMDAPGLLDLIDARAALCEGAYDLASSIAARALRQLSLDDPLRASAAFILGDAAVIRADTDMAETAFRIARGCATDSEDYGAAIFGSSRVALFGERPEALEHLTALEQRRDLSPTDLVRYGGAMIHASRFGVRTSLSNHRDLNALAEDCLRVLPQIADPGRVSAFLHSAAYGYCLNADYQTGLRLSNLLQDQIDSFDLEFVRPFSEWARSFAYLGLRRFGESERALQRAEQALGDRYVTFHDLNIRALRARLLIQTGRALEARDLLDDDPPPDAQLAMRAEYLATRALALAVSGETETCLVEARTAETVSKAADARTLAAAARAVALCDPASLASLMQCATQFDTWDAVICALRSSPRLVGHAACAPKHRSVLRRLCERAGDRALARQLGIKIKPASSAESLLSQREHEVLGLLAQGLRNQEIARALFISESTVKVHVRHVFEKLGVRTRSEAAARFSS